jgi:hypothetical protein
MSDKKLAIIFICLGFVFLTPLTYHNNGGLILYLGPLYSLFFLYIGFKRLKKSRQSDNFLVKSLERDKSAINLPNSFEFSSKKVERSEEIKPASKGLPPFVTFILCIAFLPAVPLVAGLIAGAGCHFLLGLNSLGPCIGYSLGDSLAYLGVLGWLVSIPVAFLLMLIYGVSKL